MVIVAEQNYSRQTPTRLRLVAKSVMAMSPKVAIEQLEFMNKKAAKTLLQVIKQAIANAVHNMSLSADSLTIKDIIVNEGPRYKRFQPVSRGRAHSILKRTAHIRVILESKEQAIEKAKTTKAMKTVTADQTTKTSDIKEKTVVKPGAEKTFKPVLKQTMRPQTTVKTVSIRKTGER